MKLESYSFGTLLQGNGKNEKPHCHACCDGAIGGYACADSIDDAIMEEALRVSKDHQSKLEAEEAAQKAVDDEKLQEQQQLEEALAQQKAEKKRQQEIARKKAEEDKEREYEEEKRREEQAEATRRAQIGQIFRNMRRAVYEADKKALQRQRAQQAALYGAPKKIQRAHRDSSRRLRQIRQYEPEWRTLRRNFNP